MCAVYKRGDKGVFYMNFTVNGKRVFKSTGKYIKKEAKHVEALEMRNPFYLDSESGFNWTANPELTGHLIRF